MDYPRNTPGVGLVNGRFVDENTTTGQPGSLIPAAWGNAVTDEILAVIVGAGLAPSEGDLGQLRAAIGRSSVASAAKLATARTIALAGDVSGGAAFDGSASISINVTLSDTHVVPGVYTKVKISSKGLVIGSEVLVPADIPSLDWTKIGSGKPTTLAGYGITDALGKNSNAISASKLETARTIALVGGVTGSAAFDGSASISISATLADNGVVAGVYTKVKISSKGLVIGSEVLVPADIPGLDWSKITTGKPTTLGGYGITDAMAVSAKATLADISADASVPRYVDPAGVFASIQNQFAGAIVYFARSEPPPGFLKANGALVSRVTYSKLFERIGTFYGAGDGATTFALPDLRGEFMRAWDDGRGIDFLRAFGSFQNGTLVAADDPQVDGIGGVHMTAGADPASFGADVLTSGATVFPKAVPGQAAATSTWSVIHGTARPRNIAMLACIKY